MDRPDPRRNAGQIVRLAWLNKAMGLKVGPFYAGTLDISLLERVVNACRQRGSEKVQVMVFQSKDPDQRDRYSLNLSAIRPMTGWTEEQRDPSRPKAQDLFGRKEVEPPNPANFGKLTPKPGTPEHEEYVRNLRRVEAMSGNRRARGKAKAPKPSTALPSDLPTDMPWDQEE